MFEVYLKERINESGSKATIADGVAKFKFEKTDDELWNNLQAAEVEDKKFMAAARQKAVEDSHKRAEQLAEKKAKEKREQERFALREQMKVMKVAPWVMWQLPSTTLPHTCWWINDF